MLLRDYAVTPDVFDIACHSDEEVCGLYLETLKDVLLSEGLVRDLRGGEWRDLFSSEERTWHRRAKELVKKLATQGRLRNCPPMGENAPADDIAWCREALETHAVLPFSGGVIATGKVKAAYAAEPMVGRIDRLHEVPWWSSRSPSISLRRTIADYLHNLDTIARCANSIMFVDPHIDPSRAGYRQFHELVRAAARRPVLPAIEIHRVGYEGSGPARRILSAGEIEQRFRTSLEQQIRSVGLRAEVFAWDDFHDRFMISNLIGISVPNGFDTTTNPNDVTRWTRLGRSDRDDVQREFDPASGRHTLRHRFMLG